MGKPVSLGDGFTYVDDHHLIERCYSNSKTTNYLKGHFHETTSYFKSP